jgi:hypothetical protein
VLPRYTAHLAIAAAAIHPLLLAAFIVQDGPLSLEGFSITGMPAFLKEARMHEDYIRRYGARPESAKWQSNSSPF